MLALAQNKMALAVARPTSKDELSAVLKIAVHFLDTMGLTLPVYLRAMPVR